MPVFHCRRLVICYTAIGFFFGLMFPVIGLAADYLILDPGIGSLGERIRTNPIHGLVALAPFVLGGVFHVIGRIQFTLREKNRQLELALNRAQSSDIAKSEFLAAMSHELRTPLNGVLGMSDLLLATELNPDQRKFVEVIQTSGRSLLGVINDILDYSKIDSGFLAIRAAPFALRSMVEKPARLLAVLAAQKGLDLIVRVDPSLPEIVDGDEARLHQIVINLVGNAIKFTEIGQIEIDVAPDLVDDTLVRVEVRDTGCGIPADQIKTVFERFSQVHIQSDERQQGTGLGLAITKGLVELMNGSIDVSSEPGRGSTFGLVLPLARSTAPDHERCAIHRAELAGRRVLVAMSNPAERASLTELLGSWGAETVAVAEHSDVTHHLAAAAASGTAFDLLLLDRRLMGAKTPALVVEIRADKALLPTAVIVLCPVGGHPVEKVLDDAAVARIFLPIAADDLAQTIVAIPNAVHAGQPPQSQASTVQPELGTRPDFTPGDGNRAMILIADDNRTNTLVAKKMIEAMGLSALTAKDGQEAVDTFYRDRPLLVFMDVNMPVMDGYQATKAIRDCERRENLPPAKIIGLTAHVSTDVFRKCLHHGMDDHMTKPVVAAMLREAVTNALGEPQGQPRIA